MQDRFNFRGITKGKVNEFVYGSLLWYAGEPQIWDKDGKNYIVKPETIQQCTGLKDKSGKLIYEGDVVTYDDRDIYPYHTPILNAVIEMRKYQWCMVYYRKDIINADTREPAEQKTWLGFDDFITSRIEVIGNIYENPELLED